MVSIIKIVSVWTPKMILFDEQKRTQTPQTENLNKKEHEHHYEHRPSEVLKVKLYPNIGH